MKKNRFLIETTNENPNLVILDYSKDSILAYDEKSKKMHYIYEIDADFGFDCSLLCEVGNNYSLWFEQAIKKLKLNIKIVETETDYREIIVL